MRKLLRRVVGARKKRAALEPASGENSLLGSAGLRCATCSCCGLESAEAGAGFGSWWLVGLCYFERGVLEREVVFGI